MKARGLQILARMGYAVLAVVLLLACSGKDKKTVKSMVIEPANYEAQLSEAFLTYSAIATYDDDTTGDVTGKLRWRSFASFQSDSTADLLFLDSTSSLAVLRTSGLFTIQATWQAYYDASTDLKVYTKLTIN